MKITVKALQVLLLACLFSASAAAQNRVYIRGQYISEKSGPRFVRLEAISLIPEKYETITFAPVDADGSFTMDFKLDKPVFCKFMDDEFFVAPGDTVSLTIREDTAVTKGYALKAEGNHRGHYTYDELLYPGQRSLDSSFNEEMKQWSENKGSWEQRLQLYSRYYQSQLDLFSAFLKTETVSPEFIKFYSASLNLLSLARLAAPLFEGDETYKEQILGYLESAKVDSLINTAAPSGKDIVQEVCFFFVHALVEANAGEKGFAENISHQYHNIRTHYQGRALEYMLGFLYKKMSSIYHPHADEYAAKIAEDARTFSDKSIKKYILKQQDKRLAEGGVLPDDVLDVPLYDTARRELKLRDVLKSLRGKYVLIDNWATWCGPCVKEIALTQQLLDSGLFKKDNIEILYLSQDEKYNAWLNFTTSRRKYMQHSYVYKLSGNSFLRFFDIKGIPRYTLISPEGKLVHADAPRPTEYKRLLGYTQFQNR